MGGGAGGSRVGERRRAGDPTASRKPPPPGGDLDGDGERELLRMPAAPAYTAGPASRRVRAYFSGLRGDSPLTRSRAGFGGMEGAPPLKRRLGRW